MPEANTSLTLPLSLAGVNPPQPKPDVTAFATIPTKCPELNYNYKPGTRLRLMGKLKPSEEAA